MPLLNIRMTQNEFARMDGERVCRPPCLMHGLRTHADLAYPLLRFRPCSMSRWVLQGYRMTLHAHDFMRCRTLRMTGHDRSCFAIV